MFRKQVHGYTLRNVGVICCWSLSAQQPLFTRAYNYSTLTGTCRLTGARPQYYNWGRSIHKSHRHVSFDRCTATDLPLWAYSAAGAQMLSSPDLQEPQMLTVNVSAGVSHYSTARPKSCLDLGLNSCSAPHSCRGEGELLTS